MKINRNTKKDCRKNSEIDKVDDKNLNVDDNTLYFQPKIVFNYSHISDRMVAKPDILIYIHIPFCANKCYFCSIGTYQSFSKEILDAYIEALIKEIEYYSEILSSYNVACIHFGGGTPSIMNISHMEKIFDALNTYIPNFHETEVVFEANPQSLNADKVSFLARHNKLSLNIGLQTFDEEILNNMHRDFNMNNFMKLIASIKEMNLYTLGIDLMCNLPLSNQKTTLRDIDIALELGINHFAIYPLRVEANTILYSNYKSFCKQMPLDHLQLEAFSKASSHLVDQGFEQYSIFHYNGTGKMNHLYSRRQLIGDEWIGLGAGANSYYQKQISNNTLDIHKYINAQMEGSNCSEGNILLNTMDVIVRELLYSLRNNEIEKTYYLNRYGRLIYDCFIDVFKILGNSNYIYEFDEKIKLTPYGILNLSSIETLIYDYMENLT